MNLRVVVLFCLALSVSGGCESGMKEFPCAPVSGVVTCDGQPVREAQIYFAPMTSGKNAIVGKPGFSWTDENGRFVLSTYGSQDGAVVGKHVVRVTTSSDYPCNCIGEETRDLMEVEVKAGEKNEFEVKLPKKQTAGQQSGVFDADDE